MAQFTRPLPDEAAKLLAQAIQTSTATHMARAAHNRQVPATLDMSIPVLTPTLQAHLEGSVRARQGWKSTYGSLPEGLEY